MGVLDIDMKSMDAAKWVGIRQRMEELIPKRSAQFSMNEYVYTKSDLWELDDKTRREGVPHNTFSTCIPSIEVRNQKVIFRRTNPYSLSFDTYKQHALLLYWDGIFADIPVYTIGFETVILINRETHETYVTKIKNALIPHPLYATDYIPIDPNKDVKQAAEQLQEYVNQMV